LLLENRYNILSQQQQQQPAHHCNGKRHPTPPSSGKQKSTVKSAGNGTFATQWAKSPKKQSVGVFLTTCH